MKHKVFQLAQFKALKAENGTPDGTFEAVVGVFNNVDRAGDRILPGAFKGSLERWKASGDPIPILFSHEWENLDAHIGWALEAREMLPKDEGLPEAVKELGGLYVKGQIDLEEEYASRVWKRLQQRRLKQFSFAYDILDSQPVKESERAQPNHYQDLIELDLLELGPCLVGMNPDTQLLGTKVGARHTSKEFEQIQQIHDLAVALGAKCAASDADASAEGDEADGGEAEGQAQTDAGDGAGKVRSPKASASVQPETYAARIAVDMIEAGFDV
jgi:HK97 family phage prohead protease